jgi:tetratricopeptide (TPR) repeat protein
MLSTFTADLAFQPVWTSVSDDFTARDHRELVAQLLRLFKILRSQKDRRPEVVDALEVVPQMVAHLRVQPGRRFVQKGQRRSADQRGRGVWAFLHTARELFGALVCDIRGIGDRDGEANCLNNLGSVEHEQENYRVAIKNYSDAADVFRDIDAVRSVLKILTGLSQTAAEIGETKAALNVYREALNLIRQSNLNDLDDRAREFRV